MTWFALLAFLSAAPAAGDRCARIDAQYLVRSETSRSAILNVILHPDGGILSIPWVDEPTVRQWSDPFEKGLPIRLPAPVDYALADGRFVIHLHGYRARPERYELWSWDGSLRVTKVGVSETQKRLVALICNAPAATDEYPADEWFCVGGRLIANDKDDGVLVWERGRWVAVGATLSLSPIGERSSLRLLLSPEDYARVSTALRRFSIAAESVPSMQGESLAGDAGSPMDQLQAVSCGTRACWGVNRGGAVLVRDLRTATSQWHKIGQVGNPDAQIVLSAADDKAVLTLANCAGRLYYFALPPTSHVP